MTNKELAAQVAELKAQLKAQPACADVDLTAISPDAVLEAQGFTPEEIANIVKAKGRREFDAKVSDIPGSEDVAMFKEYVTDLGFPVRIVFELPEAGAKVDVSTHRPTGKGAGNSGRTNGQKVQYLGDVDLRDIEIVIEQGGACVFKSYAELCRALHKATGDEKYDPNGQSGKVVLDRCGVRYQLVDADAEDSGQDDSDNDAE